MKTKLEAFLGKCLHLGLDFVLGAAKFGQRPRRSVRVTLLDQPDRRLIDPPGEHTKQQTRSDHEPGDDVDRKKVAQDEAVEVSQV